MYDYDRRRMADGGPRFESVLFKAGEADDHLNKAYLALNALKAGMDGMHEIPTQLHPLYKELMTSIDSVTKAQKNAYQLRSMVKKLPR